MVLIVVPLTLCVLVLSLSLPKTYEAEATPRVRGAGQRARARRRRDLGPEAGDDPAAARLARRARAGRRQARRRDGGHAPRQDRRLRRRRHEPHQHQGQGRRCHRARPPSPTPWRPPTSNAASAADRQRFAKARVDLEQALDRLRTSGASQDEITAVQDRLSELSVSEVSGSDELQLAVAARPPERPRVARPLQNTVLALFAALFLAVLAALGRDFMRASRRRPAAVRRPDRARAARRAPRHAAAPSRRRGGGGLPGAGRRGAAGAVGVPARRARDGRPGGLRARAVVAGLGRALTGSGVPTLLVSADLRHAALHEELEVPRGPGVGEVLDAARARSRRERRRADRAPRRGRTSAPSAASCGCSRAGTRRSTRPRCCRATRSARCSRSSAARSTATSSSRARRCSGRWTASSSRAGPTPCSSSAASTGSPPSDATELGEVVAGLDAPVLGAVLIGGGSVCYSLPAARSTGTLANSPRSSAAARPTASPRPR